MIIVAQLFYTFAKYVLVDGALVSDRGEKRVFLQWNREHCEHVIVVFLLTGLAGWRQGRQRNQAQGSNNERLHLGVLVRSQVLRGSRPRDVPPSK
jgi:hypothetical protein